MRPPGGLPLAGAAVSCAPQGRQRFGALTDEDGVARFLQLSNIAVALGVTPPASAEPPMAATHVVAWAPGRVDVTLGPAYRMRVQVLTDEGRPPAEPVTVTASRTLRPAESSWRPEEPVVARVDASGVAVLALAPGTYGLSVGPVARDSCLVYRHVARVDAADAVVEIVLRRGVPLTATVVALRTGSRSLGVVQFRVVPAGAEFREAVAPGVVAGGSLTSRPLPPDERFDVYLLQRDDAQRLIGWGLVRDVRPGDGAVTVELVRGGRARGRVVDHDGQAPADGVPVFAYRSGSLDAMDLICAVVTDEEGRFALEGLPPWPLDLAVWGQDWYTPEPLRGFTAGDEELRVRVERTLELRGRVVVAGTEVAPGGQIRATCADGGTDSAEVGHDGRFVFRCLHRGRVGLRWVVGSPIGVALGEVTLPTSGEVTLSLDLSSPGR